MMRPSSASPRKRVPQRPSSASIYNVALSSSGRVGNVSVRQRTNTLALPQQAHRTGHNAILSGAHFGVTDSSDGIILEDIDHIADHKSSAVLAARAFLASCGEKQLPASVSALDPICPPPPLAVKMLPSPSTVSSSSRSCADTLVDTTALRAAVAFLQRGDYAAAYRTFTVSEGMIAAALSVSGVTADDRVAACKFYLNYGVCAAACGMYARACDLFVRASQEARNAGSPGTTLLHACAYNKDAATRLMHASHVGSLDLRSSAEVASEFYIFGSASDAALELTAPHHPCMPRSPCLVASSTDHTGSIAPDSCSATLSNAIVASLISNTRSMLQADSCSVGRTKLCVMVSRANAAAELGWYFSTMEVDELRRPMEMRIKGEASIDGGFGGVTNDILSIFFKQVSSMFAGVYNTTTTTTTTTGGNEAVVGDTYAHDSKAFPDGRTSMGGVRQADYFFALGALMLKCFVEGRAFASLRTVLSLDSVARLVCTSSAEVVKAGLDAVGPMDAPWVVFDSWASWALATWGTLDGVVSLLQADLHRMDTRRGTKFGSGIAWYWQQLQRDKDLAVWEETFVPLCPSWWRRVAMAQHCEAPLLQRLVFLWDHVVWRGWDAVLHIRRGVSFASRMLPDPLLSSILVGGPPPASSFEHSIHASVVNAFCNTVCGGDVHGPVVTGKDIVQRLEFRGWGVDTRAPYLVCSWLHRAPPADCEDFLAMCTGLTALPFEPPSALSEDEQVDDRPHKRTMPPIVVMPSADRLYARTCFFTLYIPRWEGCSTSEVHACIDAALCAYRHSAVMHEVDIS